MPLQGGTPSVLWRALFVWSCRVLLLARSLSLPLYGIPFRKCPASMHLCPSVCATGPFALVAMIGSGSFLWLVARVSPFLVTRSGLSIGLLHRLLIPLVQCVFPVQLSLMAATLSFRMGLAVGRLVCFFVIWILRLWVLDWSWPVQRSIPAPWPSVYGHRPPPSAQSAELGGILLCCRFRSDTSSTPLFSDSLNPLKLISRSRAPPPVECPAGCGLISFRRASPSSSHSCVCCSLDLSSSSGYWACDSCEVFVCSCCWVASVGRGPSIRCILKRHNVTLSRRVASWFQHRRRLLPRSISPWARTLCFPCWHTGHPLSQFFFDWAAGIRCVKVKAHLTSEQLLAISESDPLGCPPDFVVSGYSCADEAASSGARTSSLGAVPCVPYPATDIRFMVSEGGSLVVDPPDSVFLESVQCRSPDSWGDPSLRPVMGRCAALLGDIDPACLGLSLFGRIPVPDAFRSDVSVPRFLEGAGPVFFIRQAVGASWTSKLHYSAEIRDLAFEGVRFAWFPCCRGVVPLLLFGSWFVSALYALLPGCWQSHFDPLPAV